MNALTVLYDADCGFCRMIKNRLAAEPAYLPLRFIAAQSEEARTSFPDLSGDPQELVVVDDDGGVYRDTDAYIMVLYALKAYRTWSLRFASPLLKPLVRNAFLVLSKNRHTISRIFHLKSDHDVAMELHAHQPITCQHEAGQLRENL